MEIRTSNVVKQGLNEADDIGRSKIKEVQFQDNVQYFKLEATQVDFKIVDFFEFIFFESGTGWHTVNNVKHYVTPQQIHISFPGQVHLWNVENCSGHRLLLGRIFVQTYFRGISFLMPSHDPFQSITLDQHIFKRFWTDLQLLFLEIERPKLDCDLFKLRLEIMLNNIEGVLNKKRGGDKSKNAFAKTHPVLEQLQQMLEENFRKEKEVCFYSKGLFMTTNYLNKLCKREWGINIKKVIDNRIVTEALKLLADDDKQSVREISVSLGFLNVSNFSRFLKSRTNYSPSQLRARLRSSVDQA